MRLPNIQMPKIPEDAKSPFLAELIGITRQSVTIQQQAESR